MMTVQYHYSSSDFHIEGLPWQEFENSKLSKFDVFLREKWEAIMAAGHFRYTLDNLKERKLPGKMQYLIQLNQERSILRRTPESFDSVKMPFAPEKFNFTKVKSEEVICELKPVDCKDGAVRNGYKHNRKHLLMVNVSPLEYTHCLLVPDVNCQIFQHMTLTAHILAIEMMLLSNHPGFRVGFNSLLALASVNHQHIHFWYLDHKQLVETAEARQVCPRFYEMVGMPTRAFIFQLDGSSVEEMAGFGHKVTEYLVENNVAHNVFFTRGTCIGAASFKRTVRMIIWPRRNSTGAKMVETIPVFNIAVAELAGHIPMYVSEKYDTITEQEIDEIIKPALLPDEEFDRHRENVAKLLQSS